MATAGKPRPEGEHQPVSQSASAVRGIGEHAARSGPGEAALAAHASCSRATPAEKDEEGEGGGASTHTGAERSSPSRHEDDPGATASSAMLSLGPKNSKKRVIDLLRCASPAPLASTWRARSESLQSWSRPRVT